MKKKLSFPQLAIGLVLGLCVVLGAIVGVGYLYFKQLSTTPPKPDYPEITEEQKNEARSLASVSDQAAGASDKSFVALVVYEDGLIMRKDPDSSSESVLTLRFEETVRVYGKSDDGRWEDVLLETTGDRGWVQIGNTKRVN